MLRCLGAGCLMWIMACQNLEAPATATAPQLVVQSVLNTRGFREIVIVSRARTGVSATVSGGIGDDEPVLGAAVTVTAPNGTVMVGGENDPDCDCAPGMYTFYPSIRGVDLRQGGTYTLHVRTTLGEEVTGVTTIPVDTEQVINLSPRAFFRERDTLRLSWLRVAGARSYEVHIGTPQREYHLFADTTITMPGNALTLEGDNVFPIGLVEVLVSAVDVNYYEYYRAQSDPFAGSPPSHLTGAVGVFGSIAPISVAEFEVR